jgi:S1-C subfamily serine protease
LCSFKSMSVSLQSSLQSSRSVSGSRPHKYVIRVMNTSATQTPFGPSVAGLEAGSAVISQEFTNDYKQYHPNSDCWVAITNHHVVGSQSVVMCNFCNDLTPFSAGVYKINPTNDLALLLIPIPHELIGDQPHSDFMVAGSPITDVVGTRVDLEGYPMGTDCQTLTCGTVASFNVIGGNMVYENTGLCNPGNSGGAMLADGKLLGINTAIMNPGSVVTIAKTWNTCKSLLTYIKSDPSPMFNVFNLAPHLEHKLRICYNTSLHPDQVQEVWDHCDVPLDQFLQEANYHKISNVLHLVEHNPHLVQEVLEGPGGPGPARVKGIPVKGIPELIVFDSYFEVTPTMITPSIKMVYPKGVSGAMISKVGVHEKGLQQSDVLCAIDGVPVDHFGRLPTGVPYFTSFKNKPASPVVLTIARQGESELREVVYRYDRIQPSNLPRIHSSALTPFEQHAPVPLGGLVVSQMTLDSAMQYGHTKYLETAYHNDLVFVVQAVHPASQEWIMQRMMPGSLMTHIDFKPLSDYGNTDQEVWSKVQQRMSAEGLQHITATFECRGLRGKQKRCSTCTQ